MLDVLIVENDPILLDFLSQEVSNQINVPERKVRKASSLKIARTFLSEKQPDWLLLDLLLPDGSGVDLAMEFVEANKNAKILILTSQADQYLLPAKILTHVHALINKADGLSPLRDAIWELCRELDSNLPDTSTLTPRQLEFLALIGEGLDTAQIAEKLSISFATAQTHRRQITRKLGVKGSALVTFARTFPQKNIPQRINNLITSDTLKIHCTDEAAKSYSKAAYNAFQKIKSESKISYEKAFMLFKQVDVIATKPTEWIKLADKLFKGELILSGDLITKTIESYGQCDCYEALKKISPIELPELDKAYGKITS